MRSLIRGCNIQRAAAFTLVELLVTIGVIAILAAILLPTLQRSREGARRAVCASNCKQWGLASQMFADEHEDIFAPAYWHRERLNPGGGGPYAHPQTINDTTSDYEGGSELWKEFGAPWSVLTGYGVTEELANCPSSEKKTYFVDETAGHPWGDRVVTRYQYVPGIQNHPEFVNGTWSSAAGWDWLAEPDLSPAVSTKERGVSRRVIISDLVAHTWPQGDPNATERIYEINHANETGTGAAWQNIAFADNHVEGKRSSYCPPGTPSASEYSLQGWTAKNAPNWWWGKP